MLTKILCCQQFFRVEDKDILVRRAILNGVLKKKSVQEVDKLVRKKYGKDAIGYLDLDFWYYYFYNGGRDLSYDRSLDPKLRYFSDLPIKAIAVIIGQCSFEDRLNLRRVSHCLRSLSNLYCRELAIIQCEHQICLKLDKTKLFFRPTKGGCLVSSEQDLVDENSEGIEEEEEEIVGGQEGIKFDGYDYRGMAIREFKSILARPSLKLDRFTVQFMYSRDENDVRNRKIARDIAHFEAFLKSLDHQLHIKIFDMRLCSLKNLLVLLPYLSSSVLKKIHFQDINPDEKNLEVFGALSNLEQWKKTKMWNLCVASSQPMQYYPFSFFEHFTEVSLCRVITNKETYKWIKEFLEKSQTIQMFELVADCEFKEFCRLFSGGTFVVTPGDDDKFALRSRWEVPNSARVFNIYTKPFLNFIIVGFGLKGSTCRGFYLE